MIPVFLVISCLGLGILAVPNIWTAITLAWGDFPPELKSVLVVITLFFTWRLFRMANLNLNQIEDFSELGQSFAFKCDDRIYCIPPIPPYVAKKLMKNARDFSQVSEVKEKQLRLIQEENENLPIDQQKPIPSELLEGMSGFYDFQIAFIITSGIIEVTPDGNKISDITKEDIEGSEDKNIKGWSTQLVMKIFKRVNEIISVEQEKKS